MSLKTGDILHVSHARVAVTLDVQLTIGRQTETEGSMNMSTKLYNGAEVRLVIDTRFKPCKRLRYDVTVGRKVSCEVEVAIITYLVQHRASDAKDWQTIAQRGRLDDALREYREAVVRLVQEAQAAQAAQAQEAQEAQAYYEN